MTAAVLLSAGDASGDLHAADLVRALRARRPELRFLGLGGLEMEKAGVEIVVQQRELAIGGIFEALGSLPRLRRARRRLDAELERLRPALVILVDSSAFNLPFARRARRAGIPVLYFVAPQVWAWRRGRIRKLAQRVDRVAVIHPFETAVYQNARVQVEYVGHPLVDRLRPNAQPDAAAARAALGFDRRARVVALLPGSRRNELRANLRLYLETARALHGRQPELCFALALAPSLEAAEPGRAVREAALPRSLDLRILQGRTREVLCACDVALMKPGTATLEATLLDRPLVTAARVHPITFALLRPWLRIPSTTMPNLVAGAPIVPEYLQGAARPARLAEALAMLLDGPARTLQRARLRRVGARLGPGGAADRAAAIAEEMLRASA